MTTKAKIEVLLGQAFDPIFLEVIDESAKHVGHRGFLSGGHYRVIIDAACFKGKKLLENHRRVYTALKPVESLIHALAIKIL